MILESILEDGEIVTCASTNISRQEFSTHLNISIKYTYQLPITHKMFEYFKIINHQFREITDEIDTHQITSILMSVKILSRRNTTLNSVSIIEFLVTLRLSLGIHVKMELR